MLSRPVNYHDTIQGLLLSRGIKPSEAGGKAPKAKAPAHLPRKQARQVNVVGGPCNEGIEMAAAAWKRQNLGKHMARKTGSDPAAVEWLLSHRI